MYYPLKNTYYLEGHTLDQFAAQHISLSPLTHGSNRIGLLLDAAIPPDLTQRHIQAAEAARATLGLRMGPYAVTSRPVGVELAVSAGASWGGVRDAGTLLEAGKRLVDAGCDAIAVVTAFPEEDDTALSEYRTNGGVDVIAGAEAVISHLLTRELCIPVAHAPALEPIPVEAGVNPKAAAEELGYTFLSCVLVGLSRAPKIVSPGQGVCGRDVDVVIVPEGACGGAAVMSFAAHGALIVVVSENGCVLKIGPEDVGIPEQQVVRVRNYAEAAGVVAAHRAGIELCALSAHVPHLQSVPSRTFAVPAHSKVRQNGSLASV